MAEEKQISERESLFAEEQVETHKVPAQEPVEETTEDVADDTQEETTDGDTVEGESEKPSGEETNDTPPMDVTKITFDEFEKDYTEKKNGAQKRIDKLTAEKYQYASEIENLRKELDALKAGKAPDVENLQEKPKYTEQQLRKAYEKAVNDGDADLQWEIQSELTKLKVFEAEQRYIMQNRQVTKQQEEEAAIFAGIVENYSFENDPDLNIKDQNSLICRVTHTLLNDERTKNYYGKMGAARLAAAVADARAYIYELRLKKKTLSKTKHLEKNLQKEKLKNSLAGSGSPGSKSAGKKKDSDEGDRESQFKKLFGV